MLSIDSRSIQIRSVHIGNDKIKPSCVHFKSLIILFSADRTLADLTAMRAGPSVISIDYRQKSCALRGQFPRLGQNPVKSTLTNPFHTVIILSEVSIYVG